MNTDRHLRKYCLACRKSIHGGKWAKYIVTKCHKDAMDVYGSSRDPCELFSNMPQSQSQESTAIMFQKINELHEALPGIKTMMKKVDFMWNA